MDMTVEQYRAWVETASFKVTDNIDGHTEEKAHGGYSDDGQPILTTRTWAYAWREAVATAPNGDRVEFTYQRFVEWSGTPQGRFQDDYEDTAVEGAAEEWGVYGLVFVDDDGDQLPNWERNEILAETLAAEHPTIDITDIDFEALLPPVITEDIDMTDETKIITVPRDNDADLRFTGERIAATSSNDNNASSDYSGSTGRWTVLRLYKTAGGKFVAQSIGKTRWRGEHDRYSAEVCTTEAEVVAFFGHGWLAKELYEEAGIDAAEDVE